MILLSSFLLLSILTPIRSDCLVNYTPKDIHSGSFVASSTSAADFRINSTLSTFTYSLPNMFSTVPQVALNDNSATSAMQSTLADGVYYSIVARPNTRQIAIDINVSNPLSWQSFKIQLLATNRSDIQLGYYAAKLQSSQLQVMLKKEVKNPVTIPFLSGFRVNRFISSSATPCYFKITNSKVSSRNLTFTVDTNCVNEININYAVYDAQSLKKQYKATQSNIRLGTTKIDPTVIDFGSTNIMGLNGFMSSFQSAFSFKSSFADVLTVKVMSTTIFDISFAYFIVENLPSQYCKNCKSGSIVSDNYCTNSCPTSSITYSSQNLKICASCDITKFLIPNDNKTACMCAIQYYLTQNGTQCSPCDISCLTCSGSRANNCLSCDQSTRVLSKGSCALKSGYTNSNYSQSQTLSPFSLINPVPNTDLSLFPNPLTSNDLSLDTRVCGKNEVLKKDSCVCAQSFFNISGECVSCPINQFFNGQSFSDCINGFISYDQMSCYCNPGNYLIDGKCQMCPENSLFDGSQCTCTSGFYKFQNSCLVQCPANSIFTGTQCACPMGLVPFVDKCTPCPSDSVFFGSSCVCSNGNPFNLSSNSCSSNNKVSLINTNMQILQDRVKASIQLTPFPSQLISNPSLISNILNINLRSGAAPTVSISYRPPDILELQFSSRGGMMTPFTVAATVNPLFASFFPNQDISTELQLST